MPLINLTHAQVLVADLDHPEGVTCGPDGTLYAGGEAGQVYRIDFATRTTTEIANTGGGLSAGLAADAASNLYICNAGQGIVYRVTPSGAVSIYSRGNDARTLITPNYPAFAPSGHLYVTDSGAWKADNGCVWAITPGGASAIIDSEACQFPNGCAVSPDGRYLYIAISLNAPRIIRFAIDAGRKVGPIETIVELPHTVPDGLAFCRDGSLLISCYRPDTIYRLLPDGSLTLLLADYEGTILGAPTNVCFAGHDLSVLIWANLGRWHLGMHAHTGLQGVPLFYPQLTT